MKKGKINAVNKETKFFISKLGWQFVVMLTQIK